MRDDGSRREIDDEEREAEKEQGRQKRARVYVCLYLLVYVSLSFILFSRVHESLYARTLCVCTYVRVYARAANYMCAAKSVSVATRTRV